MPKSFATRVDEALLVAGRLVAFGGGTALVFFLFGVMLKPIFPDGLPLGDDGRLLYLTLLAVALLVVQVVIVAALDRGRWSLAGLWRNGWRPGALAFGLGVGLAVAGGPALLAHYTALAEPGGAPWSWPTGEVLLLTLASTLVDAFLLRGYAIGMIASKWGEAAAVLLTALVAVLLAMRAGVTSLEAGGLVFLLATLLGAVRLRTGSLAAAWLAQFAAETVADGMGGDPLPLVSAGVLAVVSFLVFRLRPWTEGPRRT